MYPRPENVNWSSGKPIGVDSIANLCKYRRIGTIIRFRKNLKIGVGSNFLIASSCGMVVIASSYDMDGMMR
jgi:hypothetical protein